ncbi:DUF2169 family type VI secretion system accessory protein [Pragia fontium]|uniref:DUF2169 family type VI secretion system accessory protein n=1 Tax=Pragia fontium TaxID=82985 RepID=UPI000F70D784|nr:DUF2169 domain-containing protein [Pragia fontium]VEJ56332.1 Uncharacterized protein conserved in bacteria [Pragia fontium]
MKLTNHTAFTADYIFDNTKDGRELLVIVIKSTYELPELDQEPQVAPVQLSLTQADECTGEPGYSATLLESDYVSYKPCCDVLLNGCAWSFDGLPKEEVIVSLEVGPISKSFTVKGHRTWGKKKPQPFISLPISYDTAFGGTDESEPKKLRFYRENPIGTGYSYHKKNINEMLLPNTEETGQPVTKPDGKYRPMSFGSISRTSPLRVQYAGTYDEKWRENVMPFMPADFDFRFFQTAPLDQQMPYIKGGEPVRLHNLSVKGEIRFCLPTQKLSILVVPYHDESYVVTPVIDTLIIEPEANHFSLISRIAVPLKNDYFDIEEVVVGKNSDIRAWENQQQSPHKTYYASLSEFIERTTNKESS